MSTRDKYYEAINAVIPVWFQLASVGRCYLYFKPNGEEFKVAADTPDGFELVTGQPCPTNTDKCGFARWVESMTRGVEFYRL